VGEGLGTYWVGAFHEEEEIKKVPDLPKQAQVVAMIPLDYPAEEKEPATDQKSLKEVVHYNR
jgi:nitroreductase